MNKHLQSAQNIVESLITGRWAAVLIPVVIIVIIGLGLWWRNGGVTEAYQVYDTFTRQEGDSLVTDTSHATVKESTPVFGGASSATTIDSTGEKKNDYSIPTRGSGYHETVRIESKEDTTELLIQPDDETTFFPTFRRPERMTQVLKGDSSTAVSIHRQHTPFFSWHVDPAIGALILPDQKLQVGATFIRVGPVFIGASAAVGSDLSPTVSGEVSTDVVDRLNVSLGISARRQVTVGLRYRF